MPQPDTGSSGPFALSPKFKIVFTFRRAMSASTASSAQALPCTSAITASSAVCILNEQAAATWWVKVSDEGGHKRPAPQVICARQ